MEACVSPDTLVAVSTQRRHEATTKMNKRDLQHLEQLRGGGDRLLGQAKTLIEYESLRQTRNDFLRKIDRRIRAMVWVAYLCAATALILGVLAALAR
ncbi:MAG: hypothetical protein IAF08_11680 [Rhizobacter sp.]|nr:hypothetical protein [Chlorobiales bacterium]